MKTSRSERLELPLADGDGGTCQLCCPFCWNSSTRLGKLERHWEGWSIRMHGACGHDWQLGLIQRADELHIEVFRDG
jgi:hypothetical protein